MMRNNNFYFINIRDNKIGVSKGNYKGDVSQALGFIQGFCDKNHVKMESYGRGYNVLYINDQPHDITPYGIDLNMMIEFCGGNPDNLKPTLEDYRDLTIDEFYKKHHKEQYQTVLADFTQKQAKLASDESAEAKKQLEQIKKTLEGLSRKTLSPSAGISIGFVVEEEGRAPFVVFLVTHDARGRGFRFSLNGALEKTDTTWHTGRLREFQEEMLNFPFIQKVIAHMPKDGDAGFLNDVTDKTELQRLREQKFLYISQQSVYIDRSKVYSRAELQRELIDPLHALMQMYTKMTSDDSGKNIFANFMFGKGSMKEAIPSLLKSIDSLMKMDASPFTEQDKENLVLLKNKLLDYLNDGVKKTEIHELIEDTVMKYSEAHGVELLTYTELQRRLSLSQKESGIFEPNYEMMKALGNNLNDFVGISIRQAQQNSGNISLAANSALRAKPTETETGIYHLEGQRVSK